MIAQNVVVIMKNIEIPRDIITLFMIGMNTNLVKDKG
jgi:hypothetical protein